LHKRALRDSPIQALKERVREVNSIRNRLLAAKVIPVLRMDSVDHARAVIDCLLDAGFVTVEVALTTPGAVQLIAELRTRVPKSFLVGAGTVLNGQQAKRCLEAGADYLVSPGTTPGIAALAHEAGRAVLLGAFTPSEVQAAIGEGSDIVKIFPASTGGPSHLAALRAVFPDVMFCPTGGVNAENMAAYFRAGAAVVGVGNSIIDYEALSAKDGPRMVAHAKRYLELAADVA
jgi:2-dehydro-3-deoxyphosphogluconate aldolase/(4S)-4-hydroxy-2-oxoglutarate aldolase